MKFSVLLPSANEANAMYTAMKIEEILPDAEIIVCNDRHRQGKGWAIRNAMENSTGDFVAILDGDGDIQPRMIKRLIPFLEDYDIVCGVKPISGLWSRRILTFFSRLYIALCFNIKVDSQTGIKIFKRCAIYKYYSDGWLFDLEMLSLAKQKGHSMIEVPIDYVLINRKMNMLSIWKTLKESITLWLELR